MTPEAPFTLWDIAKGLASALVAVCLWALSLFKKRIEAAEVSHADLVQKVRELELNTVSRPTFQRHEVDIYGRLDEMRKDATGREDRIVAAFKEEFRDLRNRLDKVLDERPLR